jgi:hypothetical protein
MYKSGSENLTRAGKSSSKNCQQNWNQKMHEDWDGPEHDVPMTISFGSSSVHNPKPDMEELYSIDR